MSRGRKVKLESQDYMPNFTEYYKLLFSVSTILQSIVHKKPGQWRKWMPWLTVWQRSYTMSHGPEDSLVKEVRRLDRNWIITATLYIKNFTFYGRCGLFQKYPCSYTCTDFDENFNVTNKCSIEIKITCYSR